jgi:hypothetical protein
MMSSGYCLRRVTNNCWKSALVALVGVKGATKVVYATRICATSKGAAIPLAYRLDVALENFLKHRARFGR